MNVSSGTERLLLVLMFLSGGIFLLIHGVLISAALTEPMPEGMYMAPHEIRNSVLGTSFGSILSALFLPLSKSSILRTSRIKWLLLSLLGLGVSLAAWFAAFAWIVEASKRKSVAADMLSSFMGGALATIAIFSVVICALAVISWVISGFTAQPEKS